MRVVLPRCVPGETHLDVTWPRLRLWWRGCMHALTPAKMIWGLSFPSWSGSLGQVGIPKVCRWRLVIPWSEGHVLCLQVWRHRVSSGRPWISKLGGKSPWISQQSGPPPLTANATAAGSLPWNQHLEVKGNQCSSRTKLSWLPSLACIWIWILITREADVSAWADAKQSTEKKPPKIAQKKTEAKDQSLSVVRHSSIPRIDRLAALASMGRRDVLHLSWFCSSLVPAHNSWVPQWHRHRHRHPTLPSDPFASLLRCLLLLGYIKLIQIVRNRFDKKLK